MLNIKNNINKFFLSLLFCSFSLFAEIINIDQQYPNFDWNGIKEEIGSGQFKTVYKGWFEGKERAFVFFNNRALTNVYFSKSLTFHSNYKHSNIINLIAFSNKKKCIVYELGKDLREYLSENELGLSKKVKLIKDICLGIEYLHKNKVLHRDLKIDNIIVILDDKKNIIPKIIDFDFYWDNLPSKGLKVNFICGTFFNTHPLIYSDGFYSYSREIFSIGILIYNILLEKNFYFLYSNFLKKPVIDIKSEVAIPKIGALELKNCYLNKDFQKYVDNYIKKIEDPFLEFTIMYCIFNENPKLNVVIYNLDIVIKTLKELKIKN